MRKRFFQPIWKFEEIEKQLTVLEESGWRLEKIKGFRCFDFVKSTSKTVRYFFTYSLTRENLNMNIIENSLVQNFGANQIKGSFLEGLGVTSVFRITKQSELTEQLMGRDIILCHYLFKNIVLNIICFLLVFIPLAIGCILNAKKLFMDMNTFDLVFIVCYFFFTISCLIYNLIGFVYQKKKLKNKWKY